MRMGLVGRWRAGGWLHSEAALAPPGHANPSCMRQTGLAKARCQLDQDEQARHANLTAVLCAPTVGQLHLAFVLRGCSEGERPRIGTATLRLSESISSVRQQDLSSSGHD